MAERDFGCSTDFSGRGVGLHVVKTTIEKRGGSIELLTKAGLGTTVRLTFPATVAMMPVLIVEVQQMIMASRQRA